MKLLLAVVVLALAVTLGMPPLMDSDEGRNAAVAREMAVTNDYVMPRLDTLPYLDKPVVYFAAAAGAMELLGPTELAARLPAYLFTLATAAIVFCFARRIGADPYVATIAYLTIPMTIAFSRIVIFDSALTFFVTAALTTMYVAIEERSWRRGTLAWAAMGLAMLTKGPVTFVLVLFVAIPFAWRRRALRFVFPLAGIVVFAAIVAPWVWGVSRVVPEFLHYVLVTETAERVATKNLERTAPPWFFLPYFLGGAAPWSLVALFSWKRLRQRDPAMLFLLLWIAIPFAFFSISQSKLPQYILPLMPAVGLLVGKIWSEARTRAAAVFLAFMGALLLVSPLLLPRFRMKPELAAIAPETGVALGLAFFLGGMVALFAKRREVVFVALTLPGIAIPLVTTPLMTVLGNQRSAKSLAVQLAPYVTPRTEIVGVEAFSGSLTFYLRRPVLVLSRDASELTSNYLMRRFERFANDPRSPLKPLHALDRELAKCCAPRLWIVRHQDEQWHALLEQRGMRRVAAGPRFVAYR